MTTHQYQSLLRFLQKNYPDIYIKFGYSFENEEPVVVNVKKLKEEYEEITEVIKNWKKENEMA
jgi:hypothetical protein